MADVSDVVNTLVGLIAGTLYPNGSGQPSINGIDVSTVPGWPEPGALTQLLLAGRVAVSVYPMPTERNVTRYPLAWQTSATQAPTLTATISGQTVTIGGAPPAPGNPQNVAILANGMPFVYAAQVSDTLASIASALAHLVNAAIPGTSSSGALITLPATARLQAARVGATATSIMEVRRQEKLFQIVVWAPTPDKRALVASAVDVMLAQIEFLTMPDTTAARLIYRHNSQTDQLQKTQLYRRDLIYSVEYATTISRVDPQVTQTVLNLGVELNGQTLQPETTVYD